MSNRDMQTAAGVLAILGATALLWPLLGRPPSSYFTPMRYTVTAGCLLAAWVLWKKTPRFIPLSVLLVVMGGVQFFAKMRRDEWAPFNLAGVLLLGTSAAACLLTSRRPDASRARDADRLLERPPSDRILDPGDQVTTRRYMPPVTYLAIVGVRIATGLLLFVLLALAGWAMRGWIEPLPPLVRLPIFLAAFPAWGFSFHFLCQVLSHERIAAVVSRREDAALEPSDRTGHTVGTIFCILVILGVISTSRRSHDAPDDARVFVSGQQMVPAPLRDLLPGEGREMTLREARTLGTKPINDGVDWSYTTEGWGWLFVGPDTGWSMEWEPEEPGDWSGP